MSPFPVSTIPSRCPADLSQFGPPHEHKGPEDFNGKRDDDDEGDETTPAPEEMQSAHRNPSMVPPQIPTHPGFQHVSHAPSASPPIGNGVPFVPRHGTPQPQGSRPSSRNHIRRVSSNLGPQHRATPPPHPAPNGFAYMQNPSVYHPNANPNLAYQPPRPSSFPQYRHPQAPPSQPPPQSIPQSMPPHTIPAHSVPPHIQVPPQHIPHPAHSHPLAQQTPMAFSQPPHPPMPQMTQAYLPDQGRNTIPTSFAPEQPNRAVPFIDTSEQMQNQMKREGSQSPPQHRSVPSKSRSIFTPIDDRGSVLARHFPVGPTFESPRSDNPVKVEPGTEDPSEGRASSHVAALPSQKLPSAAPPTASRTQSMPAIPDIKPPSRTNSGQLPPKRPQLKVQIPSENSDRGSATAESTSRDSAGKAVTPAKANADTSHSGVVLPPPSPSAGAILSAGAQGPPNPFARPPPPGTTAQNNNAYSSNNNIETPISALPSRFVSETLLPSPSSFFSEWGFGRSGPDSNMLPSPLAFPTPAVQSGPGFAREDEQDRKRKSPEGGTSQDVASKKPKP